MNSELHHVCYETSGESRLNIKNFTLYFTLSKTTVAIKIIKQHKSITWLIPQLQFNFIL